MPMKRHAFACLAPVLVLILVPVLQTGAQAQKATISVSTASDFVRALGPDRTIFLQSGDYLLSEAYGAESSGVEWRDSAEGKELVVRDLHDLVIRGMAGTRIIVDSPTVYLLDIVSASNIRIDNVIFSRKVAPDAGEVSAGGLYFDGCRDVELDRCSFEGTNGYPVELSGCERVNLGKCRITQGFFGALSVMGCTGVGLEGCTLWRNQGGPLLSIEESSSVSFGSCLFSDNEGGIFIDIYSDQVAAWNIRFDACIFRDNEFDYFAKDGFLPTTDACTFDGNSFGEDWIDAALAPAPRDENVPSSVPRVVLEYTFAGTDLALRYPSGWDLEEGPRNGRVGFFSPSGYSFLLFSSLDTTKIYGKPAAPIPDNFEAAAAALCLALKADGGLDLSIEAEAPAAIEPSGLLGCVWTGTSKKAGGAGASVRVRFLASGNRIYALAAFAADPLEFAEGSDANGILISFGPVAK